MADDIVEAEVHWRCEKCARPVPSYVGQCPGCRSVNTLRMHSGLCPPLPRPKAKQDAFAGLTAMRDASPMIRVEDSEYGAQPIGEVERDFEPVDRLLTGVRSLDVVLGSHDHGAARGAVVLLSGEPGAQKCLGRGTMIMMADGSTKSVENVRIGEKLMGPDSRPRIVLSTSRGRGPLYIIHPIKGQPWVCNDRHILTLTGTRKKLMGKTIDVSLTDHQRRCEAAGIRLDKHWKLFRVPVEFPTQEVSIDPYLVGLWLGDGHRGAPRITNSEPEIIAYCSSIAVRYGLKFAIHPSHNSYRLDFAGNRIPGEKKHYSPNVLRQFFCKRCEDDDGNKIIPREYIINDESTRFALLAGMIDTDGCLRRGNSSYDLTTVSKPMCDQAMFLLRSLGFAAYATAFEVELRSGCKKTYYRITISGDLDRVPCLVPRKKAKPRKQIKRVLCTGFSAEAIGDGDFFGFELNGDGRFLLADFTVTHNSTCLLQSMSGISERGETTLFVTGEQTKMEVVEYANRLGLLSNAVREHLIISHTNSYEQIEHEVEIFDPSALVLDSLSVFGTMRADGNPGDPKVAIAIMDALYVMTVERKLATFVVSQVTKDGDLSGSKAIQHKSHVIAKMRVMQDPIERYPLEAVAGGVGPDGQPLDFVEVICPMKNRFGKRNVPGYFVVGESGLLQSIEIPNQGNRRRHRDEEPGEPVF